MFSYERLQRIKQILYEQKRMDVSALSSQLAVSETTIRRDLEKLQEQGFLTKTYGGAVLNSETLPKSYADLLEGESIQSKKYIASIASQLIIDGEAIFLSGEICQDIAEQLEGFNDLTVVTNDIAVANLLFAKPGIRLIVIGGQTNTYGTLLTGEISDMCINSLFVHKAFLDVQGIDLKYGLTASYMELALFYRKIFSIAKEIIIVAQHIKFNHIALSKINPIISVQRIVTNQEIDDEYKRFCFENGIMLYTTFML